MRTGELEEERHLDREDRASAVLGHDLGSLPREIGRFGDGHGPTVICFAGVHGNEPAGVIAAQRVLADLERHRPAFRGRFVALLGNRGAMAQGARFLESDLNRLWSRDSLGRLRTQAPESDGAEQREQRELLAALDAVVAEALGSLVAVDLHSSSAVGVPFTIVSDTMSARRLALSLPIPTIFGLEERLDGTLEGYLGARGIDAVAIEGGQHDEAETASNHEAALWTVLVAQGCLARTTLPDFPERFRALKDSARGSPGVVEVRYRHALDPEEVFRMAPGYQNFSRVRAGEALAEGAHGPVHAPGTGFILLPLYQGQGEDGFFLGREVPRRWLRRSAILRGLGLDRCLPWLPGVTREGGEGRGLRLAPGRNRERTRGLLELFGYRRALSDGESLILRRTGDPGSGA